MPIGQRSWRWPRWAAAAVVAGCGAACSPGPAQSPRGPGAGCASPVNERLDPASTIHVFPGGAEPHYLTDPPTSGPHQVGPPVTGVLATPIPRPRQVAVLESGFVLLQFEGLPPAQVQALAGLAGAMVTVAPPAGPLASPVVATAWTWKLECGSVTPASVAALKGFIAAHQGHGSGAPPG